MTLRARALRGGSYLVLRQGLGLLISAVGFIMLARILGPEAYGLWAAAYGIYTFLSSSSGWGINVYLIRRQEEPPAQDYHQAFSLLLLLGLTGAGLAYLVLPFLEGWVRLEGFGPVAVALFVGLPINLVSLVPFARLERALDYRRVAFVELSGQIALYLTALPLATQGWGAWAPVAGWWAQQLLTLGLLYRMAAYRPQLRWERARVRAMMGYGLGILASDRLWELRNLVNPLVVGRYAGTEAVGQVAFAIRLAELLSNMLLIPVGRLSIP